MIEENRTLVNRLLCDDSNIIEKPEPERTEQKKLFEEWVDDRKRDLFFMIVFALGILIGVNL